MRGNCKSRIVSLRSTGGGEAIQKALDRHAPRCRARDDGLKYSGFAHYLFFLLILCLFFSTSCSLNDAKKPGYEIGWLWTDMMYPVPYEPYSKNPVLPNGLTMQPPVEGTVHREAYLLDSAANPLPKTNTVLKEGAHLYQNFCVMCHGQMGKGDGPVAAKFLPPPDYQSERVLILSSGEIFNAITKGKGAMPAHAGQIDPKDRWKIVHYLESELQGKK